MLRVDGPSGELREFLRVERRDGKICAITLLVLLTMVADLLAQQAQEGTYLRLCGACVLMILIGAHLVEQRRLADIVRTRLWHEERYDPSSIDPLTHLHNHRHLRDAVVEKEAGVAAGRPCTLLVLDIDDLSGFNRSHGRDKGDDVLQYIASLLKLSAQPGDAVLRVDGDEFLVIASRLDVEPMIARLRAGADESLVSYVIATSVWEAGRSFESALLQAEDAVRRDRAGLPSYR